MTLKKVCQDCNGKVSYAAKRCMDCRIKFLRISENNPMYGKNHSLEANEKMRKSHIGKTSSFKGKHHSKESREKLRQTKLGKKLSTKHIKSIIDGKIRNGTYHISPMEGKKHSLETKLKMSESSIKRICNNPIYFDTKPELQMKSILIDLEYKFIHPHPIHLDNYHFAVDFYIPSLNLIIEVDGKYWHNYPIGRKIDHIRTKEMEEKGYKVLRFWEGEFNKETVNESINKIYQLL